MKCYECGGTYQQKTDLLEIIDPYVGKIYIQGVPYYKCDKCDDILYTEEISRAIERERSKRLQELLNQLPIGDFTSAAETALMLGISRQALHKNRRINHGFIYQTKFGGFTVYLMRSVIQFKKTGDGRFPLYFSEYKPAQYIEDTIPLRLSYVHTIQPTTTKSKSPRSLFFQKSFASLEENSYAN